MANYKKVFVKGCLFYPKREQDVFCWKIMNKKSACDLKSKKNLECKKHFEKKIAF